MPKTTLFICKSCHHSSEERPEGEPADGQVLVNRIFTLATETLSSDDLEIQPVGCLWTCDKPCSAAFSAPCKPTYLITNLPLSDDAIAALLQFSQLYSHSTTGDVPYKQSPEVLRSAQLAKIPSLG